MQNPNQTLQSDNQPVDMTRVKPQEGNIQQPASQRSTMQSVSLGEVPSGNEENILGSVASIHDQMQPGSFMSPISDRKSGSLENLSGEDKPAEPGMITQGVEAVKDALYLNKQERQEIKEAITTEAKALGESISGFAQRAVEKVEELVHAAQAFGYKAAGKLGEFVQNIENKVVDKSQEAQQKAPNKTYLKKSARKYLRKAEKKGHQLEKKLYFGAGMGYQATKKQRKAIHQKKEQVKNEVQKDAAIVKQEVNKDAAIIKDAFQYQSQQLQRKFRGYRARFYREYDAARGYARDEARDLRARARGLITEFQRDAYKLKQSVQQKAQELPQGAPLKGQKNTFVLSFDAQEWNQQAGFKPQQKRQFRQYQGKGLNQNQQDARNFLVEISAHEWQSFAPQTMRGRATFYTAKAQDYLRDTARNFNQWNIQRNAKRFLNQASRRGGDIKQSIRDQVYQWADTAEETAERAKRALIEKKAALQFQAELLTTPKMPSQEALQRKQAVNNEVKSHFKACK